MAYQDSDGQWKTGSRPLPKSGPLPEDSSQEAFVYYYLITADIRKAMLLANYYPNGALASRTSRKVWNKPATQRIIKETVERMAKNKLRTKRPTNIPEANLETVENLVATAEEVLVYLTACMRGKITEEVLMARLSGEGQQVIERLRKEVSPRDRTKAAELLAKRYGLLEYKYSIDSNSTVVFVGSDEVED